MLRPCHACSSAARQCVVRRTAVRFAALSAAPAQHKSRCSCGACSCAPGVQQLLAVGRLHDSLYLVALALSCCGNVALERAQRTCSEATRGTKQPLGKLAASCAARILLQACRHLVAQVRARAKGNAAGPCPHLACCSAERACRLHRDRKLRLGPPTASSSMQ